MMMKGKMERERGKKLNFQLFEIEIVLELVYTQAARLLHSLRLPSFDRVALTAKMYRIF